MPGPWSACWTVFAAPSRPPQPRLVFSMSENPTRRCTPCSLAHRSRTCIATRPSTWRWSAWVPPALMRFPSSADSTFARFSVWSASLGHPRRLSGAAAPARTRPGRNRPGPTWTARRVSSDKPTCFGAQLRLIFGRYDPHDLGPRTLGIYDGSYVTPAHRCCCGRDDRADRRRQPPRPPRFDIQMSLEDVESALSAAAHAEPVSSTIERHGDRRRCSARSAVSHRRGAQSPAVAADLYQTEDIGAHQAYYTDLSDTGRSPAGHPSPIDCRRAGQQERPAQSRSDYTKL